MWSHVLVHQRACAFLWKHLVLDSSGTKYRSSGFSVSYFPSVLPSHFTVFLPSPLPGCLPSLNFSLFLSLILFLLSSLFFLLSADSKRLYMCEFISIVYIFNHGDIYACIYMSLSRDGCICVNRHLSYTKKVQLIGVNQLFKRRLDGS